MLALTAHPYLPRLPGNQPARGPSPLKGELLLQARLVLLWALPSACHPGDPLWPAAPMGLDMLLQGRAGHHAVEAGPGLSG